MIISVLFVTKFIIVVNYISLVSAGIVFNKNIPINSKSRHVFDDFNLIFKTFSEKTRQEVFTSQPITYNQLYDVNDKEFVEKNDAADVSVNSDFQKWEIKDGNNLISTDKETIDRNLSLSIFGITPVIDLNKVSTNLQPDFIAPGYPEKNKSIMNVIGEMGPEGNKQIIITEADVFKSTEPQGFDVDDTLSQFAQTTLDENLNKKSNNRNHVIVISENTRSLNPIEDVPEVLEWYLPVTGQKLINDKFETEKIKRGVKEIWKEQDEDEKEVNPTVTANDIEDKSWRWYLKESANHVKNTEDDLIRWYLNIKGKDMPKYRKHKKPSSKIVKPIENPQKNPVSANKESTSRKQLKETKQNLAKTQKSLNKTNGTNSINKKQIKRDVVDLKTKAGVDEFRNVSNQFNIDIESLKIPVLVDGVPVIDNVFTSEEKEVEFKKVEDTLLLVNVIFIHGNRTVDGQFENYPKDPYSMLDYYPVGMGQLTNSGKLTEYLLGKQLRQRYEEFLGTLYYPGIISARSTDMDITKMSLELVLAGLFPAKLNSIGEKNLGTWQPIPYDFVPLLQDKILFPFMCTNYFRELYDVLASPRFQNIQKKYASTFEFVSNKTGFNETNLYEMYKLYCIFKSQNEYGLRLPEWTTDLYPKVFEEMTVMYFYAITGTYELQRIAAGAFMKKVIKDCEAILKSPGDKFKRKMFLYSANDFHISSVLISLGIFDNETPNYGSHIIFEFHVKDDTPGIKIFYDNRKSQGLKLLRLKGCSQFCPMIQFKLLVNNFLPLAGDSDC